MAVIENLKHFIRHGKQATTAGTNATASGIVTSDPLVLSVQSQHGYAPQSNAAVGSGAHSQQQGNHSRKEYDEAIARLVAEEKEQSGKLPQYPGLEQWILLQKMGDGAFSNVYQASHITSGQKVAIKVVRKYELSNNQRSSILKEVQIMRQIDHPNIVKLYDFKETRDYYYLILELLEGGELFHQIVRLTYFSEDLSRHVILQVAEALKYLHEESGVVHRDIKPENLLFEPIPYIPSSNPQLRTGEDEDKADEGEFIKGIGGGGIGRVKVADFGLSKVVWDSVTMTPCGTVGYTAPEIVKDERYSKSVDMWALGCVLYTMLCGFPPFYDESIPVLTEKVARGQYTFLSPWWDEISKSAQDLISHLLSVNPAERYSIEEFMAHPWIRNTASPTLPAHDAPPTATRTLTNESMLFETPDTPTRRHDFRSPGVVSLREVFDVSYAVHRMEEEGRRKAKAAPLNALNEDDEDGSMARVEKDLRTASITEGSDKKRRVDNHGQRRRGFELNMDNSTLLGRRKKAVQAI